MRLDYGTQLSPAPIKLSVGTLRKPTLREITDTTNDMSFEKFNFFQVFLKMTPEKYYGSISLNNPLWDSLSEDAKDDMTMYSVILQDEKARDIFLDIFNFFFLEKVIFTEGFFILLKNDVEDIEKINPDDIRGVVKETSFLQILNIIQQILGINDPEDEPLENLKFKNEKARKNYLKILKGQKEKRAAAKNDINLSIPNIISSVASRHPSVNLINIWDYTVFQLLDSFNRLQANAYYDIDASRVSTWGDEKKTFDATLWYKNNYDKK